MPTDLSSTTVLFTLGWFVLYWILGGVAFAIVTATRFIRLRKTRFSCLFTVASLAAAYCTTVTTDLLTTTPCTTKAGESAFMTALTCSPADLLVSGALWFGLLLCIGCLITLVSRAEKRPAPVR